MTTSNLPTPMTTFQEKIKVRKALFVETGTYNDITFRPYETNIKNRQLVDTLYEATQGGQNVDPSSLGLVASQIVKPKSQVSATDQATIPNGWKEKRLRFIIDLDVLGSGTEYTIRKIIQGYTDYSSLSRSGKLDPNMKLYINNVFGLRNTVIQNPNQQATKLAGVIESTQLLRSLNPETNGMIDLSTYTMRPYDVLGINQSRSIVDYNPHHAPGIAPVVQDFRAGFSDFSVKRSKRKNNNPSNYLNDLITGHQMKELHSREMGNDSLGGYKGAMNVYSEGYISNDPFLHQLNCISDNFRAMGFLTWGELSALFPDMDVKSTIIAINSVRKIGQYNYIHASGDTEHWYGSGNETVWATILSQSIPSLMIDCLMCKLVFSATNESLDGNLHIEILDARGYIDGLDLTDLIKTFKTRLHVEVLNGLSNNNLINFSLRMDTDINNDTKIGVRVANHYMVEFATPTFCDSLFSPVITTNNQTLERIANDLNTLSTSYLSTNPVARPIATSNPHIVPQGGSNYHGF